MDTVLTVDVEDWYQTSDFNFPVDTWGAYEDRVEKNTYELLELFDRRAAKATFFVLGCVGYAHPKLVQDIADAGHEVGCHGGWHQMLTRMTPLEVRKDLVWSKALLEDLSGKPVTAFRAPSWSISWDNLYVLILLEELGFEVDSSLQPFRTPLSGVAKVPRRPFHPVVQGKALRLLEFPSCVDQVLGLNIPFSGGLYLRMMPTAIVDALLQRVRRRGPSMVYVHPWEFDPEQPHLTKSPLIELTHYYGLSSTKRKLEHLLNKFTFCRLSDVAAAHTFPKMTLAKEG